MYDYDIVCIGGGPGGSACAMRSADRGKKVAIIEARLKNGSGGTCVNRGCIPTKALMASTIFMPPSRKPRHTASTLICLPLRLTSRR